MMISRHQLAQCVFAAALVATPVGLLAQGEPAPVTQSAEATARDRAVAQMQRGSEFLVKAQQPDGLFVPAQAPIGMHALALKSIAQSPGFGPGHDAARRGYERLLAVQLDSGGIYKDALANYNTAIAITALAAADDPQYLPAIQKAAAYLKDLQWTDTIAGPGGEKIDQNHPWFGGWGYGGFSRGPGRPDLSNAHMAIEALHEAGLAPGDPAYENAMRFVTRLQNASETNDRDWAGDDGGFVYGPAADGDGESFAGEYTGADGRRMLRSYGSMTYAGLKSMIYAGLTKDDPRVKAAWNWIRSNWTLDENPGMRAGDPGNAQYGMYYYYHTLARALRAYGEPVIVDSKGTRHDWRVELIDKLATLQRADGSWAGDRKWMEDNPVLATSYAMLALQEALASLEGK